MATNKMAYGATTALSITLNGLANQTARTSLAVDNSNASLLFVDAHVSLKFSLLTGGLVGDHGAVNVYGYGSEDGTTYGPSGGPSAKEAIDGSDRTIVVNFSPAPSTLWGVRIGVVHIQNPAGAWPAGVVYVSPPMSVAQAFGGSLPRRWGIVVENRTNIAFAGSGCSASYTGLYSTTV